MNTVPLPKPSIKTTAFSRDSSTQSYYTEAMMHSHAAAVSAAKDTEIFQLTEFSKHAARAMNDALLVLDTIEGEGDTESDQIDALIETLRDLTLQAHVLNGVMSQSQLEAKL